jgi:hypothetical protein
MVADAKMLSEANLAAMEDAGLRSSIWRRRASFHAPQGFRRSRSRAA